MNSRVYSAVDRFGTSERAEVVSITPPWRTVTTEQVREAIRGTPLQFVVEVLESVANPPLPLELTLPKAIALAGACLSQPVAENWREDEKDERFGVELSRVRINTAGGQACNIYTLIVARSGVGKDIGNAAERIAEKCGYLIGTSGSAEGLADSFVENGAGLLPISEFTPWLNQRHWQHNAASWITDAWSKGWFRILLSKRQGSLPRESQYCYPSIIANIQPELLAEHAEPIHMDSGFFCRFLISLVRDQQNWRPSTVNLDIGNALEALHPYRKLNGVITVPEKYLGDLWGEFERYEAPLRGHWSRLVNEYGPRIAVMLACQRGLDKPLIILPEHWEKAAIILRWFFSMAEEVLGNISEDKASRKFERDLERFYQYIKKHGPVSKSDISHWMHRGTNGKYRKIILAELEERGRIRCENGQYSAMPGSLPG